METVERVFAGTQTNIGNIWDQIKGMDDVYALSGLERGKPVIQITVPPQLQKMADEMLDLADYTILCNLINGTWKKDWAKGNERVWYPWLQFVPGSGFRFYGCDCVIVLTSVGARPGFRHQEDAKAAYEKFPDLCNRLASYNSTQSQ